MTLGFGIPLVSNKRQETFRYFNSPTSFILFKKESITLIKSIPAQHILQKLELLKIQYEI